MPVVPGGARKSKLNLQVLHGGEKETFDGLPKPCVPDSCRLAMDHHFLIKESLNDVLCSKPCSLLPGSAIALSVLGLNLLGYGLRDIIDPKMQ